MKNFLIISLSNIGDVILTTPVMASLKESCPDSHLTVVLGPKAVALLKGSRLIDELVVYDKKASLLEKLKMIRTLRKRDYEAVIDLRNTIIPFLVKTKRRSPLFRRFKQSAMRDRHLEISKAAGHIPSKPARFDFFNEDDQKTLQIKLAQKGIPRFSDFIVIAPIAASGQKTWPLKGFQAVLSRLLLERNEKMILVGDARERPLAQPLAEISDCVVNLAGELSLRETAGLVHQSKLVLANDSAVMHLGYEMERPVVAIFGPTDPQKYGRQGPYFRIVHQPVICSNCRTETCVHPKQFSTERFDAETVYQACKELLQTYANS